MSTENADRNSRTASSVPADGRLRATRDRDAAGSFGFIPGGELHGYMVGITTTPSLPRARCHDPSSTVVRFPDRVPPPFGDGGR